MINPVLQKILSEEYVDSDGTPNDKLKRLYINVFDTPNGQIVLEDLRHRFFYYAPLRDLPIDEGSRRVVLHIDNMMLPIEPKQVAVDTEAP